MWEEIASRIVQAGGPQVDHSSVRGLGGGCINRAHALGSRERACFVKFNKADALDMFEAEEAALREMAATQSIRVPHPWCTGVVKGQAFIALEYLEMGGRGSARTMGEQLARMHQHKAERFGWHRDNTIGSTPQINTQESDWLTFYREHRLRYQLELAAREGTRFRQAEALLECLPKFFEDYMPEPSLVHGDLWGGNASFTSKGEPVLFDPATYYGDRETDIAFTELFGGFGAGFYEGYQAVWPLDKGYQRRKDLYNLYHLLNHHNLFGGGYGHSAQQVIERLLRD